MALTIKTLSDSASTACFMITNDAGGESGTIVLSDLSGAGSEDVQSVVITKIVGTAVDTNPPARTHVDLTWGDGTVIAYLPPGQFEINETFEPTIVGAGNADIDISIEAETLCSFKIYVSKANGFPKSMGHARYRR